MKRGIRAYRFLSNYLTIPSEASLKKILSKVNLQPGISQPFLALLKKKVENLKSRDRQCVLLFDEVFLRGRFLNNNIKNIVTGFEDFGQRGRTDFIADHAMVFMVQGLHVKWTLPIAYYFVSKTCPASLLKYLIEDVVKALTDIGIIVKATVSDQGPTNRTAIDALRKSSGDNIIYSVAGQRLVHIWDMPHILKNIRNSLITSDLEFSSKKVAKWRQLIDFYIYDQTRIKLSSLTMRHVNPQGRDKMRVSYAAQRKRRRPTLAQEDNSREQLTVAKLQAALALRESLAAEKRFLEEEAKREKERDQKNAREEERREALFDLEEQKRKV
ncbi:DNA transposase [Frankliniella fusca]|uniref:DNA transposase n=1 Tax=Frankliniella fusca TaxID=407009 RepID=A0AAE1I2V9_9NEOP|nr:DNA transposase [Frankliniella fusca]